MLMLQVVEVVLCPLHEVFLVEHNQVRVGRNEVLSNFALGAGMLEFIIADRVLLMCLLETQRRILLVGVFERWKLLVDDWWDLL